jgi:hypothetical protein
MPARSLGEQHMFWRRISVLAVYEPMSYQSGYQGQNVSRFQAHHATFTVPDALADGQAGLKGVSAIDLIASREAGCGWIGIGRADGVVGCSDEAYTTTDWEPCCRPYHLAT